MLVPEVNLPPVLLTPLPPLAAVTALVAEQDIDDQRVLAPFAAAGARVTFESFVAGGTGRRQPGLVRVGERDERLLARGVLQRGAARAAGHLFLLGHPPDRGGLRLDRPLRRRPAVRLDGGFGAG